MSEEPKDPELKDLTDVEGGSSPSSKTTETADRRRQRRRLALLAVMILVLAGVSGLWVYYARTRKPLTIMLPSAPVVAQAMQPHFLFSIYGVEAPLGVAVTPSGDRIYVTESRGERQIHAFDRDGNPLFAFAPPGTQPLQRTPVYVALDSSGRVYVSDRRRHTIDVYSADGEYLLQVPPLTEDGFWAPLGVDWIGERFYLTDVTKDEHKIMVLSSAGERLLMLGQEGQEPGQFWFPNAVVADSQGRLYVSDGNNGRLQVFDVNGGLLYIIGDLGLPRGMAIADDRLYIVDTVAQAVKVYDVTGERAKLLFSFGDLGVEDGQFNYPGDIAVDETGRLYIADRANNRVQVWSY